MRKELKNSRTRIQDLETSLGISRKNAVQTTEAIVQALHVHQGKKMKKKNCYFLKCYSYCIFCGVKVTI